jgi:hypothetical protein
MKGMELLNIETSTKEGAALIRALGGWKTATIVPEPSILQYLDTITDASLL